MKYISKVISVHLFKEKIRKSQIFQLNYLIY